MNPFDPFDLVNLSGDGTMRNVTLALPRDRVRTLLPHGVELGPQEMTPPGTHPVILGFHDMFRLHLSVPSPLPSLTYHEHSVGIPYCHVAGGIAGPYVSGGPYYFMPLLLLDSVLATLGGVMFWGYPKRLASFTVDTSSYTVTRDGKTVASVSWGEGGEHVPVDECEAFALQREAISQPLMGMLPLSLGPFFVVADFPKRWDVATVRPLETITELHFDYVPGLPAGRYPAQGASEGIDVSVVGSYELQAPWRMSMPYPPGPW